MKNVKGIEGFTYELDPIFFLTLYKEWKIVHTPLGCLLKNNHTGNTVNGIHKL